MGTEKTILTPQELKRRERVLKDAVASCAIEGMRLAPEDLEEVRRIAMSFETSDEMVAELKKRMGIDAPPPILWTTDRSF